MWGRRKQLLHLYEELDIISVFDRLLDPGKNPDHTENDSFKNRQARRSEILAEIAQIKSKSWFTARGKGALLSVRRNQQPRVAPRFP
jgi:hypothetical protein